jgi:hypothetical protein
MAPLPPTRGAVGYQLSDGHVLASVASHARGGGPCLGLPACPVRLRRVGPCWRGQTDAV